MCFSFENLFLRLKKELWYTTDQLTIFLSKTKLTLVKVVKGFLNKKKKRRKKTSKWSKKEYLPDRDFSNPFSFD